MAYEIEIKPNVFSTKHFSIDADHLTYDDTQMDCRDITGFAYGSMVTKVEGIRTSKQHSFRFMDSSRDELVFSFYAGQYMDEDIDEIAARMKEEMWRAFGGRIATQAIARISTGGTFDCGGIEFTSNGALLKHRPIFGKNRDVVVPWNEIDAQIFQGNLTLRAGRDSGVSEVIELATAYNSPIILHLLQMISNDSSFAKVLGGK